MKAAGSVRGSATPYGGGVMAARRFQLRATGTRISNPDQLWEPRTFQMAKRIKKLHSDFRMPF